MSDRHVIQIDSRGMSTVVGLNRAHVVVDRTGEGVATTRPVNEWVMPGENTFDVLLAPAESDEELDPPRLQAHAYIADAGSGFDKPIAPLARFEWPLAMPAPPSRLPHMASLTFSVANPPPCRLWQDADQAGLLTDSDQREILGLIERFRDALMKRDPDTAFALMEYRYRDVARAHGLDQAALEADIRELYGDMFGQQRLHCEPLELDDAVFTMVGAGKVVMVNRGLGTDALRVEGGEAPARRFYGIGVYVARLAAGWTIVR